MLTLLTLSCKENKTEKTEGNTAVTKTDTLKLPAPDEKTARQNSATYWDGLKEKRLLLLKDLP
jgi:hypothetical protein